MNRRSFLTVTAASLLALPIGCKKKDTGAGGGKKMRIALLPKSKGNAYFLACERGARAAADELGIEMLFNGPTDTDAAKQNEIVENWITQDVQAIAAAAENGATLTAALARAQEKGIKVITYDSDVKPEARSFFVNQATAQGIGETLMDTAAQLCGEEGEFAIILSSFTSSNMNEWRKFIEARLAAKYPKMKLVDTKACDDKKDKAQIEATNLLSANANLKCIMAICSPAVPGAAEAVKQAQKVGAVKVLGLGLPSENRAYVHEGVTQAVILWKVEDLGYLTITAAKALVDGKLKPGDKSFSAGKLGEVQIEGDNILLGKPFVFTKENIDQFQF